MERARPLRRRQGRWGVRTGTGLLLIPATAAVVALATSSATPAVSQERLDGAAVYQLTCAACHGTAGQGQPGEGVTAGPSLRALPVAYLDLVLRTGRMPIAHPQRGVVEDQLSSAQRDALVDWAQEALDLTGTLPEVGDGDAALGQQVYTRSCAACHGAAGGGGVAGGGTLVPPVTGVDRTAIVEALRVGPFEMPEFGDQLISDEEAEAVAAYTVEQLTEGSSTPLGLTEASPVTAAALTAVVMALVLAATVVVARVGRAAHVGEQTR